MASEGAWDFWGMIASAVLRGISSSSKNKSDKKKSKEEILLGGVEDRKTVEFSKALDYFYTQKDWDRKRRGAADYSQFKSLDRFAPNYKATFNEPAPVMPVNPDYVPPEEKKNG